MLPSARCRPFLLCTLVWLLAPGCTPRDAVALDAIAPRLTPTAAPPPRATPAPWNIVLVTVDTLRGDVLGYAGGAARTPRLDALAKEAWTFRRCISASMLTNPAHVSLMTSLYPQDHGVYSNDMGVQDNVPTLAQHLRGRGYQTGAVIGFAHLNPDVSNLGQGFDRLVGAPAHERRAADTSRAGLALLDGLPAGPFFAWLHYTDPHAPYEPPEAQPVRPLAQPQGTAMRHALAVAPRFQRDNPWFQGAFKAYAKTDDLVARYLAEVESVDAALGSLLDGLAARGHRDDTVVVITADHGENLGEHDLYFHHGGLYETTVHVPLLIRVPQAPPADLAALVQSVDIAPTLLELVQQPAWEPQRGQSLVPYARQAVPPRPYAFSEHMLGQLVAVRSAEGSLIVHRRSTVQFPSYPFRAGRQELYDRRQDPQEQHPLPLHSPLGARLRQALATFVGTPHVALTPRPGHNVDRDGLRSLGYTQ